MCFNKHLQFLPLQFCEGLIFNTLCHTSINTNNFQGIKITHFTFILINNLVDIYVLIRSRIKVGKIMHRSQMRRRLSVKGKLQKNSNVS